MPRKSGDTSEAVVVAPSSIDKADERRRDQLYWESIKDLTSVEVFRSYIKRFPQGDYVAIAEAKIEQLKRASGPVAADTAKASPPAPSDPAEKAYRDAVSDGSETKLREFVNAHPGHAKAADLKLMLDERDNWKTAERNDTRAAYERYLLAFPKGLYALAARERIAALANRDVSSLPAPEPPAQRSSPQTGNFSPSFNCAQNRGRSEQAICSSRRLSQLDVDLSQIFTLLYGRFSSEQGVALRNSQREWLKTRNACGEDTSCLENLYISRIQQLRGLRG
jgi:uncharacterized protein YecT (DUF1311 family)